MRHRPEFVERWSLYTRPVKAMHPQLLHHSPALSFIDIQLHTSVRTTMGRGSIGFEVISSKSIPSSDLEHMGRNERAFAPAFQRPNRG
jgi:hypothetical protein